MKVLILAILTFVSYSSMAQFLEPDGGYYRSERLVEPDTIFYKSHSAYIEPNGTLYYYDGADTLRFDLSTPETVDKAYLISNESGIYVIYEDTDMMSGTSYLESFSKHNSDPKFVISIPGFNLGQPMIKDDFAYVSCIGFVGKVNIKAGEYTWKYEDLYNDKTGAFNSFETPKIEGDQVIFESFGRFRKQLYKVVINDSTGNRIE